MVSDTIRYTIRLAIGRDDMPGITLETTFEVGPNPGQPLDDLLRAFDRMTDSQEKS